MIKKLFLVVFLMPAILFANDHYRYRRARYNKDFMMGVYIGLMLSKKEEKQTLPYVSVSEILKKEIDELMLIPSVPSINLNLRPLSDDITTH